MEKDSRASDHQRPKCILFFIIFTLKYSSQFSHVIHPQPPSIVYSLSFLCLVTLLHFTLSSSSSKTTTDWQALLCGSQNMFILLHGGKIYKLWILFFSKSAWIKWKVFFIQSSQSWDLHDAHTLQSSFHVSFNKTYEKLQQVSCCNLHVYLIPFLFEKSIFCDDLHKYRVLLCIS